MPPCEGREKTKLVSEGGGVSVGVRGQLQVETKGGIPFKEITPIQA